MKPMTKMTEEQARHLTAFITSVRHEWRAVGVLSSLEKASATGSVYDVAHALLNIAEDPSVLTPGLLPGPGPHWRRTDGTRIPRRGDHNQSCPDHTDHAMPCTHRDHLGDMTPEDIAAAAAECRRVAAQAKADAQQRRAEIETKRQEATQ